MLLCSLGDGGAIVPETELASLRTERGRAKEGTAACTTLLRQGGTAFGHGLTHNAEVDRAIDNLVKSGKMFNMPARRDSTPMAGASRGYQEYGEQHHPRSRMLFTSNAAARPPDGRYAAATPRLR